MEKKITPISQARLRAIDDPTAAFPIGSLVGISHRSETDEPVIEEMVADPPTDVSEDSDDAWHRTPGNIYPAFLVLALLVGALAAMLIVAVAAMFMLLG